jgi:3-hydroxyacyl-CoA dehydrogenase/enoyl-CoA hydratase/3-hydroxybutyryl-CoA epimerase
MVKENAQSECTVELRESGVAVLRLGHVGDALVTFDEQRMNSLKSKLEELGRSRPTALIIAPVSEEMFCAGADLKLIERVTDPAEGAKLAKIGQDIFAMIERLPFPTIAAISGPCVGGGCELALACRYRIITDSKNSSIGLPEIQLGILPGFGGTQRLPRLVGLPLALDVILAGKILKPQKALKIGLVDEIVPFATLIGRAEALVVGSAKTKRRALSLKDRFLTFTGIGRGLVAKQVGAKLRAQTKGFYPAPPKALEAAIAGLASRDGDYALEARYLGELVASRESKALVRIFFLNEGAKGIGKSGKKLVEGLSATVVGAGVMGAGIAGSLARSGMSVVLQDTDDAAVARGINHIKSGLERSSSLSPQEKSFIVNRVEPTSKDSASTANSGVAIEAVFESMEVKKKLFSRLASVMSNESILATNTSSLSVSEIAKGLPNPERVIGMHFFNPVEKMPLVEIVRAERTNDKTVVMTAALAVKLGKSPIVVKDVPGFLVNRILTPYLCEAAFLVQEGVSITEIDKAATAFGMPMGPIRLLDEVGLDVAGHVVDIMVAGYGERMNSPNMSAKLAALGRKGRKTNSGFYDYVGDAVVPFPDLNQVLGITASVSYSREQIQDRLLLRLVNEAVRCHDEGVAGYPGKDAVNQIDLGSVMGFGFPPFRGGLLFWAESIGAAEIYRKLSELHSKFGARFEPASGLKKRAEQKKSLLDK